jgi:hypothetical protein
MSEYDEMVEELGEYSVDELVGMYLDLETKYNELQAEFDALESVRFLFLLLSFYHRDK